MKLTEWGRVGRLGEGKITAKWVRIKIGGYV